MLWDPSCRLRCVWLLLLIVLTGCAGTPQTRQLLEATPPDLPPRHELTAVPFYPQEQYQCGPASLAALLNHAAVATDPQALVPMVYVPNRQGSFQVEMLAATRRHQRLAHVLEPRLDSLLRSVAAGQPVLVLQNLSLPKLPQWHFAVAVGYDLEQQEMILRSGLIERYTVDMRVFERTWRRSGYWGMVALRPGEVPTDPQPHRYLATVAAFEHNASAQNAELAWQAGISRWPDEGALLTGYGNHLYQRADIEGAKRLFRQAITVEPAHAPAYNNLAWLLAEQGALDEALQLAQQAVTLGGEHAAHYQRTLDQLATRQKQ